MSWKDYFRPDWFYNYFFAKRWQGVLGDGDAIVLVPYSDGQLFPKRGYYEKHLIGNLPGYETEDGDIYVSEGWGDPVVYLFGIPVVLALNPSEHSAVIEPLKALIAHKRHDAHEFIRVDKEGQVLEVGKGVEQVEPSEPAGGDPGTAAADGGAVPTASERPTDINYEVEDGLFDLTPTGIVARDDDGEPLYVDEDGKEVLADQADGWIVSQAKAADLIPSKTSSSELKLMQQRERNAMADATELLKYVLFGAVGASVMWLVFFIIFALATGSMPGVV